MTATQVAGGDDVLTGRQCHGILGCIRRGALRGNGATCLLLLRFLHGRIADSGTDKATAEMATMVETDVALSLAELIAIKPETEFAMLAIQLVSRILQSGNHAVTRYLGMESSNSPGSGGLTSFIASCWSMANLTEDSRDIGPDRRFACKACFQTILMLMAPADSGGDGVHSPSTAFAGQFVKHNGGLRTVIDALDAEMDGRRDRPKAAKPLPMGISGPPCCGGLMPTAADAAILIELLANTVSLFDTSRQAPPKARRRIPFLAIGLPLS